MVSIYEWSARRDLEAYKPHLERYETRQRTIRALRNMLRRNQRIIEKNQHKLSITIDVGNHLEDQLEDIEDGKTHADLNEKQRQALIKKLEDRMELLDARYGDYHGRIEDAQAKNKVIEEMLSEYE